MKIWFMIPVACMAVVVCSNVSAQNATAPILDHAVYQSTAPQGVAPPQNQAGLDGSMASIAPIGSPSLGSGSSAIPPTAGTARDQGYTGDMDNTPSPWEMETVRGLEGSRQKGDQVEVASRRNGVSTDPTQEEWFHAWSQKLESIGIRQDKINFEGSRLTQSEFALWASRQVWAVEAGLISP